MTAFAQHHCHAEKCKTVVKPSMFMCRKHWYMIPENLRKRVWNTYVPGQEITKTPTLEYLEVTRECIELVAKKEGLR
jgi:predicted DNA-binding protein (MmcQ/YjbR family)